MINKQTKQQTLSQLSTLLRIDRICVVDKYFNLSEKFFPVIINWKNCSEDKLFFEINRSRIFGQVNCSEVTGDSVYWYKYLCKFQEVRFIFIPD
jgi:hypothetical protein